MECSIWYPNSKKWYIKHDKDCFIRYSNSEKWYIRHSKERFIWYPNSEKRYIRHLKDCFIRFPNSEKWYIKHEKECFIRHDHPNSEERYIAPWQSWILDSWGCGFRIPRSGFRNPLQWNLECDSLAGFRIPWGELRIPKPRIKQTDTIRRLLSDIQQALRGDQTQEGLR